MPVFVQVPEVATTVVFRTTPDGRSDLIVLGPRTRGRYHPTRLPAVCVRVPIRPSRVRAALGVSPEGLVNRAVRLTDLWGSAADTLAAELAASSVPEPSVPEPVANLVASSVPEPRAGVAASSVPEPGADRVWIDADRGLPLDYPHLYPQLGGVAGVAPDSASARAAAVDRAALIRARISSELDRRGEARNSSADLVEFAIEALTGTGIGLNTSAGIDLNPSADVGINTGVGARFDTGTGTGTGTGFGAGAGVRTGTGLRTGVGTGAGVRAARLGEVAARAGVSERRLRTLFSREVGLSPKHVARIGRLRTVLSLAGTREWAAVADDAGFFDQAHMISDFRSLMGVSPAAYLRGRLPAASPCVPLSPA